MLCFHPVSAPDDGRRFVPVSSSESFVLAEACPPEHRPENSAGGSGHKSELLLDFLAQHPYLQRDRAVRIREPVLHGPENSGISVPKHPGFRLKALAHAQVRMILVPLPTLEHRAANAEKTRAVALE